MDLRDSPDEAAFRERVRSWLADNLPAEPGREWSRTIRRWTLVPWGFLTLGITAGAWWSYEVLGWGGFWAWDPVENASFMPWLTATAFVHSVMVQERRDMLKTWTLSLIITTFLLTLLGTFLTRSGVVSSVSMAFWPNRAITR